MEEGKLRIKLQSIIDIVRTDISSIRTGRATPGLVEDIVIDAYGGQAKLKVLELATTTAPDTQTLEISPFDKSIIGDIRKGIMAANVGLNPNIDGDKIRISLPPLTTEDREKYIKFLATKLEGGRVMVRQARGDEMRNIKSKFEAKELAEDQKFAEEKKLQSVIDEYIEKIEKIGEIKKAELLQI